MKHVFGASSHLVFYLCNRIIELDGLNPDDCIFFFTRNYHCPVSFNNKYRHQIHTEYNVSEGLGRVFDGWHIHKTNRNIKAFDSLVDSYIKGEDFLWYSQVCSNDICSLFVTKPNCKGYYVLEDGMASYRDYNPQTFTGWKYPIYKYILKTFWRRCFDVKNHFITTDHPKFRGCIATTFFCFPLHQQYLRCVDLPFETIDLGYRPDAVISIDPIYLWVNEQSETIIFSRIAQILLSKHYSCIAFKFHPCFFAQINENNKRRYTELVHKYFGETIIEIPSDTCLENVLITYKCDFYTISSSTAIYGSMGGARCYTYMPILEPYLTEEQKRIIFPDIPALRDVFTPIS